MSERFETNRKSISTCCFLVSRTTGVASNPRASGIPLLMGMAYRPSDNKVFGLNNAGNLSTINPTTGAATLIGATGSTYIEGDIAYDASTDFLFRIQEFSNAGIRLTKLIRRLTLALLQEV